jgi:hypothetical protein
MISTWGMNGFDVEVNIDDRVRGASDLQLEAWWTNHGMTPEEVETQLRAWSAARRMSVERLPDELAKAMTMDGPSVDVLVIRFRLR